MRILFVNDLALGPGSGAEVYLSRLVAGLAAAGDEVEVFAGEVTHRGAGKLLDFWDPLARRALAARAAAFRPDVVHFHNVLRELSPAVLGAAPEAAAVLTVHDFRLFGGADRSRWEPRAIVDRLVKRRVDLALARRRVACAIGVSAPITEALQECRFRRVRLLPAPVPEPLVAPLPVAECRDVVCLSRLYPDKGVHVLVQAFGRILDAHPGSRLLLAGTGPDADRVQALARPYGERVQLCGLLDEAGVSGLLGRSRVVVVPSLPALRREGTPLVALEAAMHGRPLVVSDDPGLVATVRRLGNGRVVPAGDAGALAGALDALLSDGATAQRLGDAGRAPAAAQHSVAAVVAGHRALYAELAAR